jgi:hypothetical protein
MKFLPKRLTSILALVAGTAGSLAVTAMAVPRLVEAYNAPAGPSADIEAWNKGVNFETLSAVYARYPAEIESLHHASRNAETIPVDQIYQRSAHRKAEMTLSALRAIHYWNSTGITPAQMAAATQIDPQRIATLWADALRLPVHAYSLMNANCYSYAVNDLDRNGGMDGNPGERTANAPATWVDRRNPQTYNAYIRQIIAGAQSDGLTWIGREPVQRHGHYLVAFFMRPAIPGAGNDYQGHEFHWARQDEDGRWSHKYGNLYVTRLDYGGNPIADPATADMGRYRFVGYMQVPEGGVDVGRPAERPTKLASPPSWRAPIVLPAHITGNAPPQVAPQVPPPQQVAAEPIVVTARRNPAI